jgi:hypothetical protein
MASRATARRLVTIALPTDLKRSIHIMFVSPFATNYVVVRYKKIFPKLN